MSNFDILPTWMPSLSRLVCMSSCRKSLYVLCIIHGFTFSSSPFSIFLQMVPYNFVPLVERHNVYHLSHMHTPIFITRVVHQTYYVNDTYITFSHWMLFDTLLCTFNRSWGDNLVVAELYFWLTLLDSGGEGGGQICPHHHVFAYTRVCMRIQVLFFFTFPHFQCGRGCNTFDPNKMHRFPRSYKSWSNLPNFHKGGPLRTSQSPWKSHFFRPLVGVVLGIQKL